MNYIDQINVFWLLDAEHLFNGNESRLYFYLLKLSNSLYWKNPLTNADGYTASMVGISVNTLKTARNRLQQAGLITFKPGGHGSRDKCVYYIISAEEAVNKNVKKVSKFDTLSAESLTPYPQPNQQKTDDINKHKPNQTKPNKEVVPSKPAPPKRDLGKKEKENQSEPFWDELVKIWFDFNTEKFSEPPSFSDADPRYLKKIIEKLKKRAASKKIEWNEASGPQRLKDFLVAAFADQWLSKHFLLRNLNEQFDTIILDQRKKSQSKADGVHEKPKGKAITSFQDELNYLYGRYLEGQLDERLITEELFQKMQSRDILPSNTGATTMEEKRKVILRYFELNQSNHSKNMNHGKEAAVV